MVTIAMPPDLNKEKFVDCNPEILAYTNFKEDSSHGMLVDLHTSFKIESNQ